MNSKASQPVYTRGSIGGTMLKTALSMLAGTLAMSGYNIVDTYFVGQLGRIPLAAMGFTFPVIMLIGCVFRGLGTGIMTTSAQAIGSSNHDKAAKLLTAGLLETLLISFLIAAVGILTMKPTFRFCGATAEVLPDLYGYMSIWYLGCCTASAGMVGNDLLIAAGDSKVASAMMMLGMLLNAALDPVFIMGVGPIPGLGIRGAAIATVASQFISAFTILIILHRRHHFLILHRLPWSLVRGAWSLITKYAVPSTIGMLMMPVGVFVTTRITAEFGTAAVAGAAAAGRLEMLAFIFPMALGISLVPMIGQNYGGKCYARIRNCLTFSMSFAFLFLLAVGILYLFIMPYVVGFFSPDPEVRKVILLYMRIVPFGFGMIEIHRYSGFFFTACGQPVAAAWLNGFRIIGLMIPLSLLALFLDSLQWLFWGRLIADVVAGGTGCAMAWYLTHRLLPEDGKPHFSYQKRPWYLGFLPELPKRRN